MGCSSSAEIRPEYPYCGFFDYKIADVEKWKQAFIAMAPMRAEAGTRVLHVTNVIEGEGDVAAPNPLHIRVFFECKKNLAEAQAFMKDKMTPEFFAATTIVKDSVKILIADKKLGANWTDPNAAAAAGGHVDAIVSAETGLEDFEKWRTVTLVGNKDIRKKAHLAYGALGHEQGDREPKGMRIFGMIEHRSPAGAASSFKADMESFFEEHAKKFKSIPEYFVQAGYRDPKDLVSCIVIPTPTAAPAAAAGGAAAHQ